MAIWCRTCGLIQSLHGCTVGDLKHWRNRRRLWWPDGRDRDSEIKDSSNKGQFVIDVMWLTGSGRGGSAVPQSVNLQRRKKKRCKWQPKAQWSFEAAIRQHKEFDYQRENRAWKLNEPLWLGKWDRWTGTNLATHRGATPPKTQGMLNATLHLPERGSKLKLQDFKAFSLLCVGFWADTNESFSLLINLATAVHCADIFIELWLYDDTSEASEAVWCVISRNL